MPEWKHSKITATIEWAADGSASAGDTINLALKEIKEILERTITIGGITHLYLKPPVVKSITIEEN
jgi:hypothetical protein